VQRIDAPQLGDALFKRGDGLLEIEVGNHDSGLV